MTNRFIATAAVSLAAAVILQGCDKRVIYNTPLTKEQRAELRKRRQVDEHFTPEMVDAQQQANTFNGGFQKLDVIPMAQIIDQQRKKINQTGFIDASVSSSWVTGGVGFSHRYKTVEQCATRGLTQKAITPNNQVRVICTDSEGRPVFVASGSANSFSPGS